MNDAKKLNDEAETFLANGAWDKGVPLLLKALDQNPTYPSALDNLGDGARLEPDHYADEFFKRIQVAVSRAATPKEAQTLAWIELNYAAFLGRPEVLRQTLAKPAVLTAGDPARQAAVGALMIELGQLDAAAKLLSSSKSAQAAYHHSRLLARQGKSAEAQHLLDGIPDGEDGLLRDIGKAGNALAADAAHSTEGLKLAHALFERREKEGGSVADPIASELILLHLRVALLEGQRPEAEKFAKMLSLLLKQRDPSAVLRASALLGPLYKIGRK